ncbi:MAG TPA: L-threonylcarbamoyladenylate synthase [Chthoniobacterales bacterium]|nr:L-threonylcarbamoyladenylate synthase [Chthoniobacterales bacterium]
MTAVQTETVRAEAEPSVVNRAAALLRQGEAIALPTETVYGLAADATREEAVLKIFQAKSRPRFDPLIVHVPDASWVEHLAQVEGAARATFDRLRNRFWPGPLTFVFPRRTVVPDIVTAGLDTVALRLSAHPVFSEIIRAFGGPLAAPSANRFGRISPTAAAHVLDELDGLVPVIVDAGPTKHGLESTIIALRNEQIEILRRGPVTEEQLAQFGRVSVVADTLRPEAPGQLPSHYAPKTRLVLLNDAAAFVPPAGGRSGLLSWRTQDTQRFEEVRCLSERQDLAEAAKNLFRYLRELDQRNLDLIVAEKVPDAGLGAAINDRLRRASRL